MPSIKKPAFPNPNVKSIQKDIDTLADAVKGAQGADGSIDVKKLEAQIETADSAVLEAGLEAIKDGFQRKEMRTFPSGCSGSVQREVNVDPKMLESGEVQSVMTALLAAKGAVSDLDANNDGKLQRGEAEAADDLSGLAGNVAESAVDAMLKAWDQEIDAWADKLNEVHHNVEARKDLDDDIKHLAGHHAESDIGQEAITWAFRDVASLGQGLDMWKIREALENAETSFLRFIPFFGDDVQNKKGHLSDREVKRFLDTDDLAGFVADKKAAIEDRLGGTYEAHYLAGKDLDGHDQLDDPDFVPSSSGC